MLHLLSGFASANRPLTRKIRVILICYHHIFLASYLLHFSVMLQELSPRILTSISQDISGGMPIWGILRANEYMLPSDPIRNVLVRKAILSLDGTSQTPVEQKILFNGAKLGDLKIDLGFLRNMQRNRHLSNGFRHPFKPEILKSVKQRLLVHGSRRVCPDRTRERHPFKPLPAHRRNGVATPSFSISSRRS